ncbi:MAG: SCO family protein [Kiloniellales bacterium]
MRRLRQAGLIVAALALAFAFGLAGAWYLGDGSIESREGSQGLAGGLERPPGGAFLLSDQEGRAVDSRDLGHQYLLLYFGYTQCTDACPIAMQTISEALAQLGAEERAGLAPLFVTIDPALDTGPELARYLENFHPSFRGLTGEAEAIASAAAAYQVGFERQAREDETGLRLIDHGTNIYLMAPDGGFLRKFDYRVASDRLAEVLAKVLSAQEQG